MSNKVVTTFDDLRGGTVEFNTSSLAEAYMLVSLAPERLLSIAEYHYETPPCQNSTTPASNFVF